MIGQLWYILQQKTSGEAGAACNTIWREKEQTAPIYEPKKKAVYLKESRKFKSAFQVRDQIEFPTAFPHT
jgi:hypothetical protein